MTVRRVLIAWELGGHLGHLARLLPIARQLREDGVQVAFAVREPRAAARVLAQEGWEVLQAPLQASPGWRPQPAVNHADILMQDGFGDTQSVLARVAGWKSLFALWRPDALLSDFSPMSVLAARVAGLPVVSIGHGFEIPPSDGGELPGFHPWKPDPVLERQAVEGLQRALQALAGLLGSRVPTTVREFYPPSECVLCTFEELEHFSRTATEFAGPIWSDVGAAEDVGWPQRDGPKVLCYLRPSGWSPVVLQHALATAGCNVLWVCPGIHAPAAAQLRELGAAVCEQAADLEPLLPQATAVVTHGGMGLVARTLQAGRRLLVLPSTAEQMILARRLVRHGLGVATLRLNNAEVVGQKVRSVLSPEAEGAPRAYAKRHAGYSPRMAVRAVCQALQGSPGRPG